MNKSEKTLTRRDFIKGAGCAAVGLAVGLPVMAEEIVKRDPKTRVVLIRDQNVVNAEGKINGEIIQQMLDRAVTTLLGHDDPVKCFKEIISAKDVVGIKSNEWRNLRTPPELEQALKQRVLDVGVPEDNVDVDDRSVLHRPVFLKATALINTRPMRTHAWSGVGSLIKNYIMFSPEPPKYHPNSCADLGALWELPLTKGKTRLNVLVMLTPLFHGQGWHHFDPKYVWRYNGLLVGTDPVALDTVGLHIFHAQRQAFFGEERPLAPPAHHIVFADTKYHLGTSDLSKIELVKLGWQDGILI